MPFELIRLARTDSPRKGQMLLHVKQDGETFLPDDLTIDEARLLIHSLIRVIQNPPCANVFSVQSIDEWQEVELPPTGGWCS